MNIFSFTVNFGDEQSCIDHFKSERDKRVVTGIREIKYITIS